MNSESLIVRFFENTLSEEERQEFDRRMESDEDFKREVAFRKELKEAITQDDRETIKQELQALENPIARKKPWLWSAAASLLILVGISSFWFFGNQTLDTDDLFNTHFEPYRNVVQPIERGDASEDTRTQAFKAYEQGSYKDALNGFNTLTKTSNDPIIQFYKANTFLELGETEKAITILESNMTLTDSLLEKHRWYLALAYMKVEKLEEAKKQLEHLLTNPNSEYKKEAAKNLLKELD